MKKKTKPVRNAATARFKLLRNKKKQSPLFEDWDKLPFDLKLYILDYGSWGNGRAHSPEFGEDWTISIEFMYTLLGLKFDRTDIHSFFYTGKIRTIITSQFYPNLSVKYVKYVAPNEPTPTRTIRPSTSVFRHRGDIQVSLLWNRFSNILSRGSSCSLSQTFCHSRWFRNTMGTNTLRLQGDALSEETCHRAFAQHKINAVYKDCKTHLYVIELVALPIKEVQTTIEENERDDQMSLSTVEDLSEQETSDSSTVLCEQDFEAYTDAYLFNKVANKHLLSHGKKFDPLSWKIVVLPTWKYRFCEDYEMLEEDVDVIIGHRYSIFQQIRPNGFNMPIEWVPYQDQSEYTTISYSKRMGVYFHIGIQHSHVPQPSYVDFLRTHGHSGCVIPLLTDYRVQDHRRISTFEHYSLIQGLSNRAIFFKEYDFSHVEIIEPDYLYV